MFTFLAPYNKDMYAWSRIDQSNAPFWDFELGMSDSKKQGQWRIHSEGSHNTHFPKNNTSSANCRVQCLWQRGVLWTTAELSFDLPFFQHILQVLFSNNSKSYPLSLSSFALLLKACTDFLTPAHTLKPGRETWEVSREEMKVGRGE